jgi:hypothetical protein
MITIDHNRCSGSTSLQLDVVPRKYHGGVHITRLIVGGFCPNLNFVDSLGVKTSKVYYVKSFIHTQHVSALIDDGSHLEPKHVAVNRWIKLVLWASVVAHVLEI